LVGVTGTDGSAYPLDSITRSGLPSTGSGSSRSFSFGC
jgi:hypothetical protein